jgi:hypothetical protein
MPPETKTNSSSASAGTLELQGTRADLGDQRRVARQDAELAARHRRAMTISACPE